MTASDKRRETLQRKCLELIAANPGISAAAEKFPKAYRNQLRQLELEGKIFYAVYGWYVKK